MPWVRLTNFEYNGYVADIDAHLLPTSAVSRLVNAHCNDGVLVRYTGFQNALTLTDPGLYFVSGGFNVPWLLVAGADSIVSVSATTESDVTPGGGLTTVGYNAWSGGTLHGIGLLNNGVDPPQYWTGTGSVADLPNWISGELCQVLRPFKNFVFAGNISNASDTFPTLLKWSSPADPGSAPASWDESDPTEDTGTLPLSDTPGGIIDMMAAGDSFFVYKEDAVYELNYIGGDQIFRSAPRFYHFGLTAKHCTFFHRGVSYAMGADDIVAHTSTEMRSIATKAVRNRIYGGITGSCACKNFVAFDTATQELMFCVPFNSHLPDYAFTYNPVTQKWGERELPQTAFINSGKTVFDSAGSWDGDSGTWDTDVDPWGNLISLAARMYMLGAGNSKLFVLGQTEEQDGSPMAVVMERKSLDFGSEGKPNEAIKFVSRIRPNIIAVAGTQVQVEIGSQMKLGDAVTWTTPQTFTVGTTRDLCFRVNGRYISWRVSSSGSDPWKLESIDAEVKSGAMW